jgi:hypothetical protein
MFAQNGPVGQAVGQGDGTHPQAQARTDQAGGFAQHNGAFEDGLEKQNRKEKEIDQAFNLLPDRSVQSGVTANQIAAQDEEEVGKEQLGKVHAFEHNPRASPPRRGPVACAMV